jgi:hypothetical protein
MRGQNEEAGEASARAQQRCALAMGIQSRRHDDERAAPHKEKTAWLRSLRHALKNVRSGYTDRKPCLDCDGRRY